MAKTTIDLRKGSPLCDAYLENGESGIADELNMVIGMITANLGSVVQVTVSKKRGF